MLRTWAVAAAALAAIGCSGSETEGTDATGVTAHALKMDVTFKAENSELAFLTPSNTVVRYPVGDIVGKPYMIATFHAGFSSGNDEPLDYEWGQVPEGGTISYSTPATYKDGPYDIVFVNYTVTEITPEIQKGSPKFAPAAQGGDLASFTLSTDEIREGDPKNALGTLRLNVEGADAFVSIENRTPEDAASQGFAAFTNTILTIP